MNNKVAAISKMMNYLVIHNLVLESKFLTQQKQWSTPGSTSRVWAIVIFVFDFAHLLSNSITLDRKRNLRKPGTLPSFDTKLITAPAEFRRCHFRFCD